MKKNIIIADCEKEELKLLKEGLEESTKLDFEIYNKICNKKHKGLHKIYIYFCYIFYPLYFFINRKKFDNIVCWQQFFAIFYAFWCNIAKVKKQSTVVACNFTYKPKKGLIGKIYKKVMTFCLKNDYIDYIHILSEEYAKKVIKEFNIPKEKFIITPFGLDDTYNKYKDLEAEYKDYYLAIGRSNRDYDFLIKVWNNLPKEYKLLIICDNYKEKNKLPDNVILRKDIVGETQFSYIVNCKAMIIPLKDENLCSGDTVLLKAMSYYKPVIVTKPSTLAEMYIENEINGFAFEKDIKKFADNFLRMSKDEEKLKKVAQEARKCFEENYSRKEMAKKIGNRLKQK